MWKWTLGLAALLLTGCSAAGGNSGGGAAGLQTLHASTMRQVTADKPSLLAAFPGGRQVLVSGGLLSTDRVYLVDLEGAQVRTLKIPTGKVFKLYPTADGVLVDPGYSQRTALWVSPGGEMRSLEVLDLALGQYGNYTPIEADAARMRSLLQSGALGGLTEWRAIKLARTGTRGPETWAFYNDRVYIRINPANTRDLPTLQAQATRSFLHDFSRVVDPAAPGYAFEVQRAAFQDTAGTDDSRHITGLTIRRGGQELKSYTFKVPGELYFDAVVVGARLYLIGDSVRYVDLSQL